MRSLIFFLILLTSGCATAGQQPTPTPSPTPVELKLEKLGKITAISTSLRRISNTDPKFEGTEDFFRIQLPSPITAFKPAQWPKNTGERPIPGRTYWQMDEAEIAISVTPLPPGLIQSWSPDELLRNLNETIEKGIQNAKGKKVFEKDVDLGSIRGREVKMVASRKTLINRVFFANDRQYALIAQLKDDRSAETLVMKMFDTFEIIINSKDQSQ